MEIDQEWYQPRFFSSIYYSGVSSRFQNIVHKFLEKKRSTDYPLTLELGATHGQHFDFVKHSYDTYILSDLFLNNELIEKSKKHKKIVVKKIDIRDLSFVEKNSIDRIILTCVLHHVENTYLCLEQMIRILKPKTGVIDIFLPNDPSILWNMGRLVFTVPKVLRAGKSWKEYWNYVKLEHINNTIGILSIIKKFEIEKNVKISIIKFPLNHSPLFLTLFMRVSISKLE